MGNGESILQEFLQCEDDIQRDEKLTEFKASPDDERLGYEAEAIQILQDTNVEEIPRSWMGSFLSAIGSPGARRALIDQIPRENPGLVKRWLVTNLIDNFDGEDRLPLVIDVFRETEITSYRRDFARSLAKSREPSLIPILIDLLDDRDVRIRRSAAGGLKKREQAVDALANRLAIEESPSVAEAIIEALGTIDDPHSQSALRKRLQAKKQPPRLYVGAIRALGKLSKPDDEENVQVLLEFVRHPDRVVAFTATDTLRELLPQREAARLLAQYGLEQTERKSLTRVADAIRLVGGVEAIAFLQAIEGDSDQADRAQALLEEIGGSQAVGVLVERRARALHYAEGRVKEFDAQGLKIFEETVEQAKKGFKISLWMSATIFVVGVILLGVSVYVMLQPDAETYQRFFGVGTGIAGIGSIMAMFYRGPMDRIEQSVANLVQTEIAFLGYIRQVTQINAMFEREYLDNEGFNLAELEKILAYTEKTMEETMPLVNRYTAVSSRKKRPSQELNNETEPRGAESDGG